MRRPDHHNEIEMNLLQSGWVTYLLGAQKIRIEAGCLSIFWAAIPHQIIDYGNEPEYFVATLPFASFLQCKLPDKLVQPLLRGEVIAETAPEGARFDYALFSQWEKDLAKQQEDANRLVLLEMEARLLRLASSLPPLDTSGSRRRAPLADGVLSRVEQMACFIAQHFLNKLTVEDVGRHVGLHPKNAMNLFQSAFGTTLIEYLTHHRISRAQRLLVTTGEKIVEIAYNSGFSSISRFNEAFRRQCGCSPREYRQRHHFDS